MSLETDALEALTHDPTKVLKGVDSLLRWLSTRNDAKALAEFREAMDDQVVLNAQGIEKLAATNEQRLEEMERVVDRLVGMVVRPEDWKDQPEHEKPTEADVVTRAAQFARATLKAGSHGKRRILWNAFFSSSTRTLMRRWPRGDLRIATRRAALTGDVTLMSSSHMPISRSASCLATHA